jgi:ABC-2 type transport system permease protein
MYLAFARSAFRTQLAYRAQIWAGIFGQLVQVFARIAIWTSLLATGASVGGVDRSDMVTYAVLGGTVLSAWDPSRMLYAISAELKNGDIASRLLRPVPYPAYLFATECGNLVYRAVAVGLPVLVIAAVVYGLKPPASLFYGAVFPAFWVLSFLLLFGLSCLGGLAAFWLMTAFSIDWFLWSIIGLLSGGFVPLWFFPDWLAAAVKYLPFAWIGFYPAAVYLGKIGEPETLLLLGIGIAWVAIFGLAIRVLWSKATTRITVQGG